MIHFPILYVEDDHAIRQSMQTILNRRFSNIYVAENGLVGLNLYHEISPRVIIVDLRMPQMGGLELIQKVREIDPNVHIIVASAHSDKEDLLSAIHLNVNRYLIKPINVNELLTHLNEEYDNYAKKNSDIIPLSHCHTYDLDKKTLLKNNRSLRLTKTENDILHLLVTNPNAPMDYARLGNEITIKNFSGQGYMLTLP